MLRAWRSRAEEPNNLIYSATSLGFMSDFVSFVVVELIRFFHGALQLYNQIQHLCWLIYCDHQKVDWLNKCRMCAYLQCIICIRNCGASFLPDVCLFTFPIISSLPTHTELWNLSWWIPYGKVTFLVAHPSNYGGEVWAVKCAVCCMCPKYSYQIWHDNPPWDGHILGWPHTHPRSGAGSCWAYC